MTSQVCPQVNLSKIYLLPVSQNGASLFKNSAHYLLHQTRPKLSPFILWICYLVPRSSALQLWVIKNYSTFHYLWQGTFNIYLFRWYHLNYCLPNTIIISRKMEGCHQWQQSIIVQPTLASKPQAGKIIFIFLFLKQQ